VGVLTAVAYAVGINLLDVKPVANGGEALVFVLAALGAIGGVTVFRKVVPAQP